MKKLDLIFCTILALGFVLMYHLGFNAGISYRPPVSVVSDLKELKCTCVPCLPDMYCLKCGHKSRDCPKLAHIFRKGTNAVNAVSILGKGTNAVNAVSILGKGTNAVNAVSAPVK